MECDDTENAGGKSIDESSAVVNSVILDYYKKFGRKRDLEQFFSLSSAESEVRDVQSLFWRRMKSQSDSDSEMKSKSEKSEESSKELCRISIKCSLPEPSSSSQDETVKSKSDSVSPPIIIEEIPTRHTDEESANDDNQSQKSIDAFLDMSANKPLSPTSSITSQRKLEWDSLADVGYANESDRKTSASSLSTLERLALKQQYSNNDSKDNNELGPPTAHSTLMDINEMKSKSKKGGTRKTTKIYKKEVDIVEVSLPPGTDSCSSQPINVNLTKHISFNMEKDGGITIDNIRKDINVSPEKASVEFTGTPNVRMDKEIQTTLPKTQEKAVSPEITDQQTPATYYQRVPVLINLNTLRKKYRKKKVLMARRKLRNKKKIADKGNIPIQEKSTEQVSAAESFEYMPGHVYNQNQMNLEQPRTINMAGNKSSLESSAGVTTTDSSKDSKRSFTKDLEKSIDLLKSALRRTQDDSELKNKLVKEVVQRLLKSRYRDDDSTTDFLSGLSFSSKKLGLGESHGTTTTNTTDSNRTELNSKSARPKKSILRTDKFNPNILASTSQSAPNLPAVSNSEKPIVPNILKQTTPNTESDVSSGEKHLSETAFGKASSSELYQKYLEALKREEAYKRHLRDKELFLKQKLVSSDVANKVPQFDPKSEVNNRLKDLIKDLTRNNYDDGSGDASRLEGGSNTNSDPQRCNGIRKQRSHSVFTLSSGNSDDPNRKANLKKKLQNEIKESQAGNSKEEHCCCPHHCTMPKVCLADSSVQVNIRNCSNEGSGERPRQQAPMPCHSRECNRESTRSVAHVVPDDITGDIKYVCLCNKPMSEREIPDNMLIYKCSRLTAKAVQLENTESKTSIAVGIQCVENNQYDSRKENNSCCSTSSKERAKQRERGDICIQYAPCVNSEIREVDKMSKTSQTNMAINMLRKSSERSCTSSCSTGKRTRESSPKSVKSGDQQNKIVLHEATRAIQTEISINPRISDPALADVDIVNDEDCVQLINERFRESSKRNSEAEVKYSKSNEKTKTVTKRESPRAPPSGSFVKELKSNRGEACCSQKIDKEIQSEVELNNNDVQVDMCPPEDYDSDNFTIPIQGTNMTLMVRIGSKANKVPDERKGDEYATQCIGTDKPDTDYKATSVSEECSKGVQSQKTDIFSSICNDINRSPCRVNDEPKIVFQREEATSKFNKCYAMDSCTSRNTYPKTVQASPKPFRRRNTDTGKFVSGCCVQTDEIKITDAVVQGSCRSGSQKSRETDSDCAKSKCSEKSSKAASCKDLNQTADTSDPPSRKSSTEGDSDPIMNIIRDITKRYSKKDIQKSKKKKCFKEIVTVLNYLLDTDECSEPIKLPESVSPRSDDCCKEVKRPQENPPCCSQETRTKKVDKVIKSRSSSPPSDRGKDKRAKENPVCWHRDNRAKKADKASQSSPKATKCSPRQSPESSEIQTTTYFPGTSSDSATCKVLNKIKRECEKYHQKRCKSHGNKKCEASSSTSVNCEQCKRVHHCPCRGHRCHKSKSAADKLKKKCVAYNLIIQTSDSMISEETVCDPNCKPLQNIVVKVPSKRKQLEKVPFKEVCSKIEKNMPRCSPRGDARTHRSRSCPNDSEISSFDDCARMNRGYTVKDYLEINRPDFLEKTSNRQQCLKSISEKRNEDCCTQPNMKMIVVHTPGCMRSMDTCSMHCGGPPMSCNQYNLDPYMQCMQSEVTRIANDRAAQRKLLSAHLDLQPTLTDLSETELRHLAKQLGMQLRSKKLAPKFTSEREMKKHSEAIYKSLPEVVRKKEEAKKENIKKTNLLMANIFKKNLQKKTLQGAVNISNYSAVIKI